MFAWTNLNWRSFPQHLKRIISALFGVLWNRWRHTYFGLNKSNVWPQTSKLHPKVTDRRPMILHHSLLVKFHNGSTCGILHISQHVNDGQTGINSQSSRLGAFRSARNSISQRFHRHGPHITENASCERSPFVSRSRFYAAGQPHLPCSLLDDWQLTWKRRGVNSFPSPVFLLPPAPRRCYSPAADYDYGGGVYLRFRWSPVARLTEQRCSETRERATISAALRSLRTRRTLDMLTVW